MREFSVTELVYFYKKMRRKGQVRKKVKAAWKDIEIAKLALNTYRDEVAKKLLREKVGEMFGGCSDFIKDEITKDMIREVQEKRVCKYVFKNIEKERKKEQRRKKEKK